MANEMQADCNCFEKNIESELKNYRLRILYKVLNRRFHKALKSLREQRQDIQMRSGIKLHSSFNIRTYTELVFAFSLG